MELSQDAPDDGSCTKCGCVPRGKGGLCATCRDEEVTMPLVMRKIVTSNVYPPIPVRDFDWVAYREGDEENGPRGYGKTETEAVRDLEENYDDTETEG